MSILVIGGGKMGLSHMAILNRLLDAGEVSLCDPSRLSRYVFGKMGIRTYKSLDAALGCGTAWRGAVVATPTSSHFAIAKQLLERGIPCFIEKPLTLDPDKSAQLAELQSRSGTYVQMGLVSRFIQPFARLRRLARSDALGPVQDYRARMMGNVVTKTDTRSWRTNFRRGGGCLNEYGPHLLDLCRSIFGDVRSLESVALGKVHSVHADDRVDIRWTHDSGVQGHLTLDWCDTSRRKSTTEFEVNFQQAVVKANNAELSARALVDQFGAEAAVHQLNAPMLPYPVNFYLRGEDYSLQLEVFLQRVLQRQLVLADIDDDLAAGVADGLAVDRLIQDVATKGQAA